MPSRKHVIVTGGSRGLGEAIVRRMLAKEYRVSTCSRSKTSFIDEMMRHPDHGGRFLWAACEVGEAKETDRFVRKPWPGPAATDCMAW
jgi:3-oxoacyl-[acyl-carrier protein] reductase